MRLKLTSLLLLIATTLLVNARGIDKKANKKHVLQICADAGIAEYGTIAADAMHGRNFSAGGRMVFHLARQWNIEAYSKFNYSTVFKESTASTYINGYSGSEYRYIGFRFPMLQVGGNICLVLHTGFAIYTGPCFGFMINPRRKDYGSTFTGLSQYEYGSKKYERNSDAQTFQYGDCLGLSKCFKTGNLYIKAYVQAYIPFTNMQLTDYYGSNKMTQINLGFSFPLDWHMTKASFSEIEGMEYTAEQIEYRTSEEDKRKKK